MKVQTRMRTTLCTALTIAVCLATSSSVVRAITQHQHEPVRTVSPQEKRTVAAFEKRVKDYVKLRNKVKTKLPKLSKDSTPEQIAAFEKTSVEALRAARAGAKPGQLFTPDIAQVIRTTLKTELQPTEKKEIRKVVLGAEAAHAPLRVNYPYPDSSEFAEMPAKVILRLPPLPQEVKYRYVGRNLFLVDTDNNLIVDFMLDALP